jgi:hypothetical protein
MKKVELDQEYFDLAIFLVGFLTGLKSKGKAPNYHVDKGGRARTRPEMKTFKLDQEQSDTAIWLVGFLTGLSEATRYGLDLHDRAMLNIAAKWIAKAIGHTELIEGSVIPRSSSDGDNG